MVYIFPVPFILPGSSLLFKLLISQNRYAAIVWSSIPLKDEDLQSLSLFKDVVSLHAGVASITCEERSKYSS